MVLKVVSVLLLGFSGFHKNLTVADDSCSSTPSFQVSTKFRNLSLWKILLYSL